LVIQSHGREKLKDVLTSTSVVKQEVANPEAMDGYEDEDIRPRKRIRVGKTKVTIDNGRKRVEIDLTDD